MLAEPPTTGEPRAERPFRGLPAVSHRRCARPDLRPRETLVDARLSRLPLILSRRIRLRLVRIGIAPPQSRVNLEGARRRSVIVDHGQPDPSLQRCRTDMLRVKMSRRCPWWS